MMEPRCALVALVLLLPAVALPAQTSIHVPDNQPSVGTCNVFPFGQSAFTYIGRVPASFMDPANTAVDDIAFSACTTGTWSCNTVQIGIGHLPTGLSGSANFPTFDASGNPTGLGSFLDYTPLWNSVAQGPFSFPYTLGNWAPLGFAAMGGTGFAWNGIDDVGFFITLNGATGTSSFHRTGTEPYRFYTPSYQATASTGVGASGLKMRLDVSPNINILSLTQSGPGVGDLTVSLTNLSPTAFEGWTLLTGDVSGAVFTGSLLGINPDGLTWSIFSIPYAPGNPFHFRAIDPPPLFPRGPFVAPPGSLTPLTGVTVDAVCLLLNSVGMFDGKSNVVRITFQ